MGIDEWLPVFDVGERHAIELAVPPEQALRLALAAPAAPDAFIRVLFRLRGLRPSGSIHEFVSANGFTILEHTATTFVAGLIAPRRSVSPLDAATWHQPSRQGSVKVAVDFRAEARAAGSMLITETRVAATTAHALLVFRMYWLFIAPFSKLIRRRWLRTVAASQARGA